MATKVFVAPVFLLNEVTGFVSGNLLKILDLVDILNG